MASAWRLGRKIKEAERTTDLTSQSRFRYIAAMKARGF